MEMIHSSRELDPQDKGQIMQRRLWDRIAVAVGVMVLVFAGVAGTRAEGTVDLQVKRVAIFSSGVAFYECEATVEGDGVAELNFRTDQINDIIKSMVVQDLDGGTIGAVSYASRDPIEKTLRSFGVDISGKPTLANLLDQLRGEPVEISGMQKTSGVILGVEKQRQQVGNVGIIEEDVLNLLTDQGMQQLPVRELGGIKLTNPKVNAELRKALETLALGHDADKKSVVLHFNGTGKRRVSVAYLLEAPIWKTTYRLVLDEEGQPFLQGWATVENATEEDWRDVKLSLISGRPISFAMDLYTPIYIPRPVEELELYASLRPPTYAGGIEAEEKIFARRYDRDGLRDAAGGRGIVARAAPAVAEPELNKLATLGYKSEDTAARPMELAGKGVASVANASEAGELFQYAIHTPVSIPRQHSAMLPIVNQKITGEKLSIYNPSTHAKYPLNGLKIKNTSELNLMQGPVTLFDGNVYAGDAKLPDLNPDEERLVAYALDLSTEVMVKQQPRPDEMLSVKIVRGSLIHTHKFIDEREYIVMNKADKPRTVILEQPYGDEWKLLIPDKPFERAPGLSRFKLDVPAGETKSQTVKLEYVQDEKIVLRNLGRDRIEFYLSSRAVSDGVKKALQKAIELQDALYQVQRQREQSERETNEQVNEQGRIRENLKTLDRNSDAYKRQLQKFDEIETQIEKLRQQTAELRAEENKRQAALDGYLKGLDAE